LIKQFIDERYSSRYARARENWIFSRLEEVLRELGGCWREREYGRTTKRVCEKKKKDKESELVTHSGREGE